MTLNVESLSVRYGRTTALRGVDLTVPTGSVLAVLGPSGCGKSTLLRTIAGLESPAAGRVSWDGTDLSSTPTHKRGFALMFQDGQLLPHQSVARNVGYPLRIRRRGRAATARRVAELLELVDLADKADRMPHTLSGGERQRVALARALAVEPRLLLLDEPLSALDRSLREDLGHELREILARTGSTALLVTHDHEEAFAVADAMAVLRDGRLVQAGSLDEVWRSPADPWTARFLGYRTVLDGPAARIVRDAVDPAAGWTTVALRRSALRVDPAGTIPGRVVAARSTPEQIRLEVEVPGIGIVPAVADHATRAAAGTGVRLVVDAGRMAPVPSGGPVLD